MPGIDTQKVQEALRGGGRVVGPTAGQIPEIGAEPFAPKGGGIDYSKIEEALGGGMEHTPAAGEPWLSGVVGVSPSGEEERLQGIGKYKTLGTILDFLSRGEYAGAGVTQALEGMLGRPETEPTAGFAASAGPALNKEEIQDLMNIAWKGAKGEQKTTYDELVRRWYPGMGRWKRMAVSLTLAIAGDPTTYLPLGAVAKGVKAGVKGAMSTKAMRAAGRAIEATPVGKFGKTIKSAFVPIGGDVFRTIKAETRYGLETQKDAILANSEWLAKKTTKEERELMTAARQNPNIALTPKLQAKLDTVGLRFDAMIDDALAKGLITQEQFTVWNARRGTYLPGIYDRTKFLSGELPTTFPSEKGFWMRGKTFETLKEADEFADGLELISKADTLQEFSRRVTSTPGVDPKRYMAPATLQGEERLRFLQRAAKTDAAMSRPMMDIAQSLAMRELDHAIALSRKEFMEKVLAEPSLATKVTHKTIPPDTHGLFMPKGALGVFPKEVLDPKLVDELAATYGDLIPVSALEDAFKTIPTFTKKVPIYMMPRDIVKEMKRANRLLVGDEASRTFIRWFDTVQNTWKLWATAVRLPFHLRNFYSNMFLAWQSGVNNPKRFIEAVSLQKDIGMKNWGKSVKVGDQTYTVKQLYDLTNEFGVRGKGWVGSDLQLNAVKELDQILKYGKWRFASPPRLGRAVGTAIEDNARIGVFLDQLRKGANPSDAAKQVRKYLFDYQDLTTFEREAMRRIFPFYTWMRKNGALQFEQMFAKPRKYQIYGKAVRTAQEPETAQEIFDRPEYFDELMYIKSPWRTEQGKPIYRALDLPPAEWNRLTNPRDLIGGMSPFKALVEVVVNRKFYPEMREMRKNLLDMQPAPWWLQFIDQGDMSDLAGARIIGPITNIWGTQDSSGEAPPTVLGVNKTFLHLIHTAFPMMNEMSRVNATPISISDERPGLWLKSYLTGVAHKAVDKQQEALRFGYEAIDAQEKLQQFIGQQMRYPSPMELRLLVPNPKLRALLSPKGGTTE